ncbi:MAG: oligosaccharide flippase family protein [Candidatus Symbiothrix sp.]|nr:oligosaccharide flippase family protein [Candidatus Symbiothrix sp.]
MSIKKLYVSEFAKFSAVLLSSNVLSQVIAIAVYPLLTRLFSPDVFGEYNWFLSLVGILTLITTGRYELAIVLAKTEKQAVALFQLSLLIAGICFVLFFGITAFWKSEIAALFHREQLVELLPFLPFYLLIAGIWQSLNNYFIRLKRFNNISSYNLFQSLFNSGLKCWFGFKGYLQHGLVMGHFWGQAIATLGSLIAGRKTLKPLKQWDKTEIINMAKTYSDFPKYKLPYGLLDAFAENLPVLLLSAYYGMEQIGLFSLALVMGFTPVFVFNKSVYQILYQKSSELMRNGAKILPVFMKYWKICLRCLLPFFVLFLFMPDVFFTTLFGSKWTGVGFYLKCMLPWLFLVVLNAALYFIPDLFSRQKTAMNIEIAYTALRLIILFVGAYFQNFQWAVALYCAASAVILAIRMLWCYCLINKYEFSLR